MRQWIVSLTVFTGDVSKDIDTSVVLPDFVFDTEQEALNFMAPFSKSNAVIDRSKETGRVFKMITYVDSSWDQSLRCNGGVINPDKENPL